MLPDDEHPADAALFTVDGVTDGDELVTATEFARGPWDPRACHGGPVSALLVRAVEQIETEGDSVDWQVARATIELVRPVPVLVPMKLTAEVERRGRSVSLVACVLRTVADDVEVARSRLLRIRRAEVDLGDVVREAAFSEPGAGERSTQSWAMSDDISFHRSAAELRFVRGSFDTAGPVQLWCRLRVPVVTGETPTGAQRAIAAADFGNGVSGELDPDRVTFLNPDVTIHLSRPAEGEWIGMDVRSHYGPLGAGFADTALFDEVGRVGRAAQSLLLAPRV